MFTDEKLSAYGGIELFRRFVGRSGFAVHVDHPLPLEHSRVLMRGPARPESSRQRVSNDNYFFRSNDN